MSGPPHVEPSAVVRRWRDGGARAALFDFNGTLSDDEPLLLAIFTELFARELGWRMTQEHYEERLLGLSDREIVSAACRGRVPDDVLEQRVQDLLDARRERYLAAVAASSPITDDAVRLVQRLAAEGVRLGVVTGAQRAEVLPTLRGRGLLEAFDVVVTEDDVERGKPDPEGYLRAAEAMDTDPGACLVLEDSVAGVHAARAAGMHVVAVGTTGTTPALAAAGVPVVGSLHPALLD